MTPTTDRPSFMSGGVPILGQSVKHEPTLFAYDPGGRPVTVKLGAGLKMELDIAAAGYILHSLSPVPPPKATVVGQKAEYQAADHTFLLSLPVENVQPKMLSGFALYRNGRRLQMGSDYRLDAENPFHVLPNDREGADIWEAFDDVVADYVATY